MKAWISKLIRFRTPPRRMYEPVYLNDAIAKAVTIFRKSPDLDECGRFRHLVSDGIERRVAARLVEFLPIAYERVLLADSGVRFPDLFERNLPGGAHDKRLLSSEPVWNVSLEFARNEQSCGVSKQDIMALAGRSAEFHAANELLRNGGRLDGIGFVPSLMLWPECGPDC